MADIIAVKIVNGKVRKQRFSEHAWKLLGINKNGWEETTPQTIQNVIETQKKSVPGKEQTIVNDVKAEVPPVIKNDLKPEVNQVIEDEKAEEFMKHLEGFSKGNIKDYFDSQEPPIEYNNKAQLPDLKKQLAVHLKYNVLELQKIFS